MLQIGTHFTSFRRFFDKIIIFDQLFGEFRSTSNSLVSILRISSYQTFECSSGRLGRAGVGRFVVGKQN